MRPIVLRPDSVSLVLPFVPDRNLRREVPVRIVDHAVAVQVWISMSVPDRQLGGPALLEDQPRRLELDAQEDRVDRERDLDGVAVPERQSAARVRDDAVVRDLELEKAVPVLLAGSGQVVNP